MHAFDISLGDGLSHFSSKYAVSGGSTVYIYIACAGVKRVDLPRVVWSDGCATRPASQGGAGSKPGAAKYFSHPHAQWPRLSRKITAVCGVSLQIRRGY